MRTIAAILGFLLAIALFAGMGSALNPLQGDDWELDPDNDQFCLTLVLFYEKFRRFDDARRALQELRRMRPANDPTVQDLQQRLEAAAAPRSSETKEEP